MDNARRRGDRGQPGFTLLELIIVVTVIGILSVILIPRLVESLNRSKQRATASDMRTIGLGIEAYMLDHSFLPDVNDVLDLKLALISYPFTVVPEDHWSTPYQYTKDASLSFYSLESYGRNRVDGPQDLSTGQLHEYDNDIILSNGVFTAWIE
jgi:general secretion pathway protein G